MNERNFKTFDPWPESRMDKKNPENTICELLRRTYALTDNNEIRYNLRVAMTMAKKMGARLGWYRKHSGIYYDDRQSISMHEVMEKDIEVMVVRDAD